MPDIEASDSSPTRPEDTVSLFEAELAPARATGLRGLGILLLVLGVASCIPAILFTLMGAWPVAWFVGAEIALAALLLLLHHRAGAERERIRLDARALTVTRIDARGRSAQVTLPTGWLKVRVGRIGRGAVSAVVVSTHGRRIIMGRFLTESDQHALAEDLGAAVRRGQGLG